MKLEQACRFTLKSSGYGIIASTEGARSESISNLENAFNDGMNACFADMGQSILEVCRSGDDVLLALCTMRSDMNSRSARRTIFTNAAWMSGETFAELMMTRPEVICSIPTDRFLASQPSGSSMEEFDLREDVEPIGLGNARNRLGLSTDDYAQLLYGAYSALFGNGTLSIETSKEYDACIQLIQDYAYAIVMGLPVHQRPKVTFSSGKDARNLISVATSAGGNWNISSIHRWAFQDDPKMRHPERFSPEDPYDDKEMLYLICKHIAEAPDEERDRLLGTLEEWIHGFTGDIGRCDMPLFLMAYYDQYRRQGTAKEAVYLLLYGLSDDVQTHNIRPGILNRFLTERADILSKFNACPNNQILFRLVNRALSQNDPNLSEATSRLISLASTDGKLSLIRDLIRTEYTEHSRKLVISLVLNSEIQDLEWTDGFSKDLLEWACVNDVPELVSGCLAHMTMAYDPMIRWIVSRHVQEQSWSLPTKAEQNALFEILSQSMTSDESAVLGKAEIQYLNYIYSNVCDDLRQVWIEYMVVKIISMEGSDETRAQSILAMESTYPSLGGDLCTRVREPSGPYWGIWECYQTYTVLVDGLDCDQLIDESKSSNEFTNKIGPFEERLRVLWGHSLSAEIDTLRSKDAVPGMPKVLLLQDLILENIKKCDQLNVSVQTRDHLIRNATSEFWGRVSYKALMNSSVSSKFDELLITTGDALDECTHNKISVMRIMQKLSAKPTNKRSIYDLYNIVGYGQNGDESYTEGEREKIRAELLEFAMMLTTRMRVMSWDILILSSMNLHGGKNLVDMALLECAVEQCEQIMGETAPLTLEELDEMYETSNLLYGDERNERIRKEIIKGVRRNSSELLIDLASLIKEDKGLISMTSRFFNKN